MTSAPIVYIVDVDSGEAMAAVIRSHGASARVFASPEEFFSTFRGDPPGCLVADISLSGLSHAELQQHLAAQGSRLPVIALTPHADVPLAVSVLKQGALTVLKKPCAPAELWQSIEEALASDAYQRQQRVEQDVVRHRYAALNDDERRVLSLMVAGHANKMIASQMNIGLRTVELRRAAVLRKMHVDSVAELVRMAIGIGVQ